MENTRKHKAKALKQKSAGVKSRTGNPGKTLPGGGPKAGTRPPYKEKASGRPAKNDAVEASPAAASSACPYNGKCGSCSLTGVPYGKQLKKKQKYMEDLFGRDCPVEPIAGMETPLHYRTKVHRTFGLDKGNRIISGTYGFGTHRITGISRCLIEDEECQRLAAAVKELCASFKIKVYDEDRGIGLLRHVLIRKGINTGELMAVLVLTDPVLPGKKNFAGALKKKVPALTTLVINVNSADTSMVLGERNITVYGPGFIYDKCLGLRFRISPNSFYQVNPVQAEVLYRTAIEYAGLTGSETVVDAYCGTGTIGLIASGRAKEVLGIELNPSAVADARLNARINGITNARFIVADAASYFEKPSPGSAVTGPSGMTVPNQASPDVIFLDPPRTGSTPSFLKAAAALNPKRIVYISCEPATLRRDIDILKKHGYFPEKIKPVDMFPFTEGVETVTLLQRNARYI